MNTIRVIALCHWGYVDTRKSIPLLSALRIHCYETYCQRHERVEGSWTGTCQLSYKVNVTPEQCADVGLSPLPGGISDEDANALWAPEWAPTFPDVPGLGWSLTHCKIVFGEDACDGIVCADLDSCPDMPQQRCPENFRSNNPLP